MPYLINIKKIKKADLWERRFLQNFQKSLKNYEFGGLGEFLYEDNEGKADKVQGSNLWKKTLTDKSYYVFREEIDLISKSKKELCKDISRFFSKKDVLTFVELGGTLESTEQKTLPVINCIKKDFSLHGYVNIDYSNQHVEKTIKFVEAKLNLPTKGIVGNFVNDKIEFRDNSLIFLFGLTLGNLYEDSSKLSYKNTLAFLNKIYAMSKSGKSKCGFVLSVDSTQDIKKLEKAYNVKSLTDHSQNVFYLAKRNGVRINPSLFKTRAKWNKNLNCVQYIAEAQEDQKVTINKKVYEIKKGDNIHIDESRKIPKLDFLNILKKSKWDVINHYEVEDSDLTLYFLGS
ncbi:MAG: L-histidine N(alpha)-methyltransferase [Alphaproteobacteria bacterium]|nr:L-histidine N(alpha)-methyltransferase [Alphaproteobacteria bacterium]